MELFIPYTQAPVWAWDVLHRSVVLVLRTNRDWPETYAPPLRAAVSAVDRSVPLSDVRSTRQVVVGADWSGLSEASRMTRRNKS